MRLQHISQRSTPIASAAPFGIRRLGFGHFVELLYVLQLYGRPWPLIDLLFSCFDSAGTRAVLEQMLKLYLAGYVETIGFEILAVSGFQALDCASVRLRRVELRGRGVHRTE